MARKLAQIQVALGGGRLAMCSVVERMGFNHDIGMRAAWVELNGHEFMAVNQLGFWRKWGPADRAEPLIEHIEREAKRRAEQSSE